MARRSGLVTILAIVGAVVLGVVASVGAAGGGSKSADAKLNGYNEVPSVSTTGRGKVKLKIKNSTAPSIEYTLSYSGLSSPATASHIHLGQEHTNGGVSAFLCGGGTKPPCPPGNTGDKVTVTGVILPADVIGPAAQGIAPGEFTELVAAIKAGATYANVHTSPFPNGEIRGQLGGDDDD
jgi:hypothetical protein